MAIAPGGVGRSMAIPRGCPFFGQSDPAAASARTPGAPGKPPLAALGELRSGLPALPGGVVLLSLGRRSGRRAGASRLALRRPSPLPADVGTVRAAPPAGAPAAPEGVPGALRALLPQPAARPVPRRPVVGTGTPKAVAAKWAVCMWKSGGAYTLI